MADALRWTTTKPKRSGYYWARYLDELSPAPIVVRVDLDQLDFDERCVVTCEDGRVYPLDYFKQWSAGPIPEPEGF